MAGRGGATTTRAGSRGHAASDAEARARDRPFTLSPAAERGTIYQESRRGKRGEGHSSARDSSKFKNALISRNVGVFRVGNRKEGKKIKDRPWQLGAGRQRRASRLGDGDISTSPPLPSPRLCRQLQPL